MLQNQYKLRLIVGKLRFSGYRRFVYHCIKVPFNVIGGYSDTEVNITNVEKMTIADKINSILYSSQYRHVFGEMAIFTLRHKKKKFGSG